MRARSTAHEPPKRKTVGNSLHHTSFIQICNKHLFIFVEYFDFFNKYKYLRFLAKTSGQKVKYITNRTTEWFTQSEKITIRAERCRTGLGGSNADSWLKVLVVLKLYLLSVWGFFREREKWLHICNHLGEQKFWSAAEHFSVHMARESSESIDTGPEPWTSKISKVNFSSFVFRN